MSDPDGARHLPLVYCFLIIRPDEAMPDPKSTEELMRIYRRSLENMKEWLQDSSLRFDEKLGIIDAWLEELREFYRVNGHCFACEKPLDHCTCAEPLDGSFQ